MSHKGQNLVKTESERGEMETLQWVMMEQPNCSQGVVDEDILSFKN